MSYERKYVAHASVGPRLLARLRAVLPPDEEFADDVVHSVYFDTPTLDSVAEVRNGDRLKAKIRVRWYGSSGRQAAFAECKRKAGAQRQKLRVQLDDVDVEAPLHSAAWRGVPSMLRAAGVEVPLGNLQPTLHVVYRRHRFVERASALRVALDTEIRAVQVHPLLARTAQRTHQPLPWVVVEAKGDTRHLPRALTFVREMGARRSSFSKYGLLAEAD